MPSARTNMDDSPGQRYYREIRNSQPPFKSYGTRCIDLDFTGKTVLITGATTGIGRAIAREFADDGATLVIGDCMEDPGEDRLPTARAIERDGGEAHFRPVDVADEQDMESLIQFTVDQTGGLDVLINNAGVLRVGSVEDVSPEEWNRSFEVNVRGIYLGSRYALPHLREAEHPRIINTASQLGMVGTPESSAYCASKGAVVNLTREMALDYAEEGITVNALAPGPVKTPMTRPLLNNPRVREQLESQVAVPFFAEPEDIAHAALFLASPRSRYLTGHCLAIDGGWTAH